MFTNHVETEVKFFVEYPGLIQGRLLSLGARDQGRCFESNICFDTPQRTIVSGYRLLRLRRDTACRLTLKSKPSVSEKDVKSCRELEVEISDFDTMQAILGELGYFAVRIYEKWRQTFTLNQTQVCLDTLPFGDFLEIEGEKQEIRQIAEDLRLNWNKRILNNYLAIFDLMREKAALPFADPTFVNFQNHPMSVLPYLPDLEAGK